MEGSRSVGERVRGTWALAGLVALGVFVWVAIPVLLIQPFKAQTPFGVALAYELRQKAPAVTLAGLVLLLLLLVRLARHVTRWWQWVPIVLLAALGAFPAWFARQNHFEWMFNPLPDPAYVPATLADFVGGRDMVVAVEIGRDSVAWPVRQMAYHHIVQDTVGGVPVVSTY
jgi:ABC-type nickel/cobalt efflux system permease component RcnA